MGKLATTSAALAPTMIPCRGTDPTKVPSKNVCNWLLMLGYFGSTRTAPPRSPPTSRDMLDLDKPLPIALRSTRWGANSPITTRCLAFWVGAFLFASTSLFAQGLTPQESVSRMTLPDGLRVDLVAAEPFVRQPVAIEWDDRGRLWVMQYLQYPNPAELQRVAVDRFSRTVYDRVPAPPPAGPRGEDRLTILTDSDDDGVMDQASDFVSGLNLASGFAFGHDGVFVLNVPYLLFYPDVDRNDQPDSPPRVLLQGFGMQDAHSVANSLIWGPDGWLYGCQGSTVTSSIRGIEFQQGVWRYHPARDRFELFCEGGGNSWGLDFDATGQLLYSTNYGGFVLLHGVQGGYYVKSFAKHGELHNPHTFGYFEHAPHAQFTGGHVTVGGIVYQEPLLANRFQGKYLAGDLLGHAAYWHDLHPTGSTFKTSHGGPIVQANDPWFAPSDLAIAPDGAVTIADWHDARMAHPDPDAQWDRSNGRIYRITTTDSPRGLPRFDFASYPDELLVDLHRQQSRREPPFLDLPRGEWAVRHARVELIRRHANLHHPDHIPPTELVSTLREMTMTSPTRFEALQSLWTWSALTQIADADFLRLLDSRHATVRRWAVRLLGDGPALGRGEVAEAIAHRLDELAEQELDIAVRQQLASTAARLPAHQAMPIINANINRSIDLDDPFLPLLWWWAVERHAISGHDEVLNRFVRPSLWKSSLGKDHLLPKLVRRYAAENSDLGDRSVVRLLQAAPTIQERLGLWTMVDQGVQNRPSAVDRSGISPQSTSAPSTSAPSSGRDDLLLLLREDIRQQPNDDRLVRLAVRLGDDALRDQVATALSEIDPNDETVPAKLAVLGIRPTPRSFGAAWRILSASSKDATRLAAIDHLAKSDSPDVADKLLSYYQGADAEPLRQRLLDGFFARPASARAWLALVDHGTLAPSAIKPEQLRPLADLNDDAINATVKKHWGLLKKSTPEEKLAEIRRLNNDLRAGAGDPTRGQALFKTHCAACHLFQGQGTAVGPDLNTANRQDRDFLLTSIVDPSNTVRKEYVSSAIRTTDNRVLIGMVKEDSDGTIVLTNQRGETSRLRRDEIEELRDSESSLMPEDLYRVWSPQELRDLFAYLQTPN